MSEPQGDFNAESQEVIADWAPEVQEFVDAPTTQWSTIRYFRQDGMGMLPDPNDIRIPEYTKVGVVQMTEDDPQYEQGVKEEKVVQTWVEGEADYAKKQRRRNDYFYKDGRLVCVRVVNETETPPSAFDDSADPTIKDEVIEFALFKYNEDGSMVSGASVRGKGQQVKFGPERFADEHNVSKVFLPPPGLGQWFSLRY